MAKSLKDILKGTNTTKIEKLSTGKDPGVDYDPKAPDDRKFVAKHVVAKHDHTGRNDDAVFNGDNIQRKPNRETNKGYDRPEDERKYGIQGEETVVDEGKTWKDSKGAKDSAKYGSKESWGRKREYDNEKLRARGDKPEKHKQLLGVSEEALDEKNDNDARHDKENKKQAFKDYLSSGKLKKPATTKKINLAKEEAECNHSAKGKPCPVHGMAECGAKPMLKEKPVNEAMSRNNINAFVKATGHGAAPAELHKEHPHVSFARKRFEVTTKHLNLSKDAHAKLHGAFNAAVKADPKGERAHGFVDQIDHGVKLHQQSAIRDYKRVKTHGATIDDKRSKLQADVHTHHTGGVSANSFRQQHSAHEEFDLSDQFIEQLCEDGGAGINTSERGWLEDYSGTKNPRLVERAPVPVMESDEDCWNFIQFDSYDAACQALQEHVDNDGLGSVRVMGSTLAFRGDEFRGTVPVAEDLAVPLLGQTDPALSANVDKTKAELKAIANKAMHIHMMGSEKLHTHFGMQDKITAARKMLGDVHDHMCFSNHERINRAMENEEQAPADQTIGSLTPSPQPANSFPDYNDDNHVGANV